jgi:hypothetical protein
MYEWTKKAALYMEHYFLTKRVVGEILNDPYLPKRTRRKLTKLVNMEVCCVEMKLIDRTYVYSPTGLARPDYAGNDNKRTKDPSPKQIKLLKEQS